MKWPGYILSLYLLILSAVPCCAFDSCPDDKVELSSNKAPDTGHEDGDGDCGNCSPFFSCEGCATATVAADPIQFEIVSTDLLAIYAGYIENSLPQIEYEFWQPPKIG